MHSFSHQSIFFKILKNTYAMGSSSIELKQTYIELLYVGNKNTHMVFSILDSHIKLAVLNI